MILLVQTLGIYAIDSFETSVLLLPALRLTLLRDRDCSDCDYVCLSLSAKNLPNDRKISVCECFESIRSLNKSFMIYLFRECLC